MSELVWSIVRMVWTTHDKAYWVTSSSRKNKKLDLPDKFVKFRYFVYQPHIESYLQTYTS